MTDTSWEKLWDGVFTGRAWGQYPPEDLIRFVARNFYKRSDRSNVRILEIGCGPGANLWYLAREGFAAAGIDGSAVAIERAGKRLGDEGLKADLKVGDVNDLTTLYPADSFDAVIDVGCLVCFTSAGIAGVLEQVNKVLKPGGKVFSRLFGNGTWGEGLGRQVEPGTFTEIHEGPLAGIGRVHFASVDEARRLFGMFKDVQIETNRQSYAERTKEVVSLIVTATKP